ncbi:MAG TPA: NUDIX domain-containing protein [Microbacteriaceae bacterium]
MIERFQVIPAAYVIFRRGDEILLQLRKNTGYRDGHWATGAAGHVEADESVLDAACREAAEELGLAITPADLTALTAMHRTHGNHQPLDERVDFFFQCSSWVGTPTLTETGKSAALQWFDLAALPTPIVPHEKVVFELLRAAAVPPIITFGFPAAP